MKMTITKYVELLAEDCIRLEAALPAETFAAVRPRLTAAMTAEKVRYLHPRYDSALDVAIDGVESAKERVRIGRDARKGGYDETRFDEAARLACL